MRLPLLICSVLMLLAACNRKTAPIGGNSACLQKSIAAWSADVRCSDAFAAQYTFQGKKVYVLYHGSCGADMTDAVLDANCKLIGTLGGITGNMSINGEPFANATDKKVVWKAQP